MPQGWQNQVNTVPAPAVEGDFSDKNTNRFTVDAGPGGLVSGNLGVTIGRFAWATTQAMDPDHAPAIVNSFGTGVPTGFVAREQQGQISAYLAAAGMTILQGQPVTLFARGGFWAKNNGTTAATLGQKAYARLADGAVVFKAAGSPGSASITGSIAAVSQNITASVAGNILTVTGTGANPVVLGAFLSGTVGGSGVTAGTQIVAQLSGTAGGLGTYALNYGEQLVTSGSLTLAYGVLTVSAVASGTIGVGGTVGGTGVVAGTIITALGTGVGNTGTYYVQTTQTMSSSGLTTGTDVETGFIAVSAGLPGELVKMTHSASVA
jgi:hypothetical protein